MRPVCQALRLAVDDRQRLTVMSAPDAVSGAEAVVRTHSDLRGFTGDDGAHHRPHRLGVGRPAEIEASALVDFAPLDVLHVGMMPMPAAAARRLAEALTAATWTYPSHGTPRSGLGARTSRSGVPEAGDVEVHVGA